MMNFKKVNMSNQVCGLGFYLVICFLIINNVGAQVNKGTSWNQDTKALIEYGTRTFVTHIGDASADPQLLDMIKLNYRELYSGSQNALRGGIIADVAKGNNNGKVTLTLWSYNKDGNNGKGAKGHKIYEIYSDETSRDYVEKTQKIVVSGNKIVVSTQGNKIKVFTQGLDLFRATDHRVASCKKRTAMQGLRNFFRYLKSFVSNVDDEDYECEKYYDYEQPVIVELKIENGAEVKKLKIPGIGEVTPVGLFKRGLTMYSKQITIENIRVKDPVSGSITFSADLKNNLDTEVKLSGIEFFIESLTKENPNDYVKKGSNSDITIEKDNKHSYINKKIDFTRAALPNDNYGLYIKYNILNKSKNESHTFKQFISFFRVTAANSDQISVYDISRELYQGLPIYKLKGGMSAEYTVQKALAALDYGISHTWHVGKKPDGTPDMDGGGPVPVMGNQDFLQQSINKTVDLYNTHLGPRKKIKTVIIGTGLASAPYISFQMKAPFLPIHFLTSATSLKEVKSITDYANSTGYPCFATAGYDPSMKNVGVAWIKLLNLPNQYKKFLIDHQVENVIFFGVDEIATGETLARKINFGASNGKTDYAAGSMYIMRIGSEKGLSAGFKDYDILKGSQLFGPPISIVDWETSLADSQIENFKIAIKSMPSPPNQFIIKAKNSLDMYHLATYTSLYHKKANNSKMAAIRGVNLNEYLIAFPTFEAKVGQLPFLYWQEGEEAFIKSLILNYVWDNIVRDNPAMTRDAYANLNFHFNAKSPARNKFKAYLETKQEKWDMALTNVTINNWLKPDVWNTSDGMNSPCEKAADAIVAATGGVASYRTWAQSLTPITPTDLLNQGTLVTRIDEDKSYTRGGGHPSIASSTALKSFSDQGITIKRYDYAKNNYWQSIFVSNPTRIQNIGGTNQAAKFIEPAIKKGEKRRQSITVAEIDLNNTNDELTLEMDYVFNVKGEDGLLSYNPDNKNEQVMDCFEYVEIPKTYWLDIPNRVMARNGAVFLTNGTVYDWDYNGIPGVVPFIKKKGIIKAKPQILSHKGEAYFAWSWGATKRVTLGHRPASISGNNLVNVISGLFQSETSTYNNALTGITYMTKSKDYSITELQPSWMINYPDFPDAYLGPDGNAVRSLLADPYHNPPKETGWNNCASLGLNNFVKKFSALAYRQYDRIFDRVPNARTFIAIKGRRLDIGVIDGELGTGFLVNDQLKTKKVGMRNWEVSNFVRHKGYDHFMHLDGGSSSQMWLNGRGPLHFTNGYPLEKDNQGPYMSRLGSTFIMLKPKINTSQIKAYQDVNNKHLVLNNSNMSFNYNEAKDHSTDKAFVSLSPNLEKLKSTDNKGIVAGNFKIENSVTAKGAILYSIGEDSYYPDTRGKKIVVPEYLNMTVMGVGKIPSPLLDSLKRRVARGSGDPRLPYPTKLAANLKANDQAFYFIKLDNGKVNQCYIDKTGSYNKYIDNEWHSFYIENDRGFAGYDPKLYVDNVLIRGSNTLNYYRPGPSINKFFNFDKRPVTHAMIGAVNVDGRFVTGNSKMHIDNFLFVVGNSIASYSQNIRTKIRQDLTDHKRLPDPLSSAINVPTLYLKDEVFAFQFEETAGWHSHAISGWGGIGGDAPLPNRCYGLNLNTQRVSQRLSKKAKINEPLEVVVEEPILKSRVHPNPTNGEITLSIGILKDQNQKIGVEIFDLLGRSVIPINDFKVNEGNNDIVIDVNKLPSGVYILKVTGKDLEESHRIVVK